MISSWHASLTSTIAILLAAAPAAAQSGDAAAQSPPRSGVTMPQWASPDSIAEEGVIEDGAIEALKEMSAYLMSANTLAMTSQGSMDVVTNDGQRIQLDGTTRYKFRRPGMVVDYESAIKSRRFIYDGKTFTVYSPTLGFTHQCPRRRPIASCSTPSITSSALPCPWRNCFAGVTGPQTRESRR